MSMQKCHHDERKLKRVIAQIETLDNILDELQEEVSVVKNNFVNQGNRTYRDRCKINKSLIHQIKGCIENIKRAIIRKRNVLASSDQKVSYPCTNLHPRLYSLASSFLHPVKGDVCMFYNEAKNFKNQCTQVEDKFQRHLAMPCFSAMPCIVHCMENILQCQTRFIERREAWLISELCQKLIEQRTNSTEIPKSEVYCQSTDLHGKNSKRSETISEVDTILCSRSIQIGNSEFEKYFQQVNINCLNMYQKHVAATPTQTMTNDNVIIDRIESNMNIRKRQKVCNLRLKHPTFYISKIKSILIKNNVIKKLKKLKLAKREKYNGAKSENKCCFNTNIQNYQNTYCTNGDDTICQNSVLQEEEKSSSTTISVELEVNVCDNYDYSDTINESAEFPQNRKPRTYVINQTPRQYSSMSHNNFKNTICVQYSSDLYSSSENSES